MKMPGEMKINKEKAFIVFFSYLGASNVENVSQQLRELQFGSGFVVLRGLFSASWNERPSIEKGSSLKSAHLDL